MSFFLNAELCIFDTNDARKVDKGLTLILLQEYKYNRKVCFVYHKSSLDSFDNSCFNGFDIILLVFLI